MSRFPVTSLLNPPTPVAAPAGKPTLTVIRSRDTETLRRRARVALALLLGKPVPRSIALDALETAASWRGIWTVERYDAPIEDFALREARRVGTLDELHLTVIARTFQDMPERIRVLADAAMKRAVRLIDAPQYELAFENILLDSGVQAVLNQLTGNPSAANSAGGAAGANAVWNNAQAMIGVGDSTTAEAHTQTDLSASTNKTYKAMDATFPSVGGSFPYTITFRSTFASADANYAWQEFVTTNRGGSNSNTSGGAVLNRKVSAQGTKASGQTWQPSATVSIQ